MRVIEHSENEWDLSWDDSEEYVIFKLINQKEEVLKEFSLQAPDYAKLYYALKDWFMD